MVWYGPYGMLVCITLRWPVVSRVQGTLVACYTDPEACDSCMLPYATYHTMCRKVLHASREGCAGCLGAAAWSSAICCCSVGWSCVKSGWHGVLPQCWGRGPAHNSLCSVPCDKATTHVETTDVLCCVALCYSCERRIHVPHDRSHTVCTRSTWTSSAGWVPTTSKTRCVLV